MAVSIREFRIDPALGEVFVELRSSHPVQAVLSSFQRQLVVHDENDDTEIVRFRLPAQEERYVLFGIVLPTKKVMFAPNYERRLLQGHTLLKGTSANPVTIGTAKSTEGEWVGAPEVIRIRAM